MISTVTRKIVLAIFVAMPLAIISFGVVDSALTPNIVRYLIAPGYLLSLRLPLGGNRVQQSLSLSVLFALTVNAVYDALGIFLLLVWLAPPRTHKFSNKSRSRSFWRA
jgi:hypothetical protein